MCRLEMWESLGNLLQPIVGIYMFNALDSHVGLNEAIHDHFPIALAFVLLALFGRPENRAGDNLQARLLFLAVFLLVVLFLKYRQRRDENTCSLLPA
jgi:hypothetical protein